MTNAVEEKAELAERERKREREREREGERSVIEGTLFFENAGGLWAHTRSTLFIEQGQPRSRGRAGDHGKE